MDAAGGQLPPGEVADGRNEKQKRVGRGDIANKTKGATCPPQERGRFRRQPTIFWTIPGESSGVSPRDWEKNRRPYWRESSEPHQGGYPRGTPLGSLLHPFLERKGCARPGMRGRYSPTGGGHRAGRAVPAAKPRCGAMGNLVACVAAVLQIKPRARSSRPGRGPAAAGGYRG